MCKNWPYPNSRTIEGCWFLMIIIIACDRKFHQNSKVTWWTFVPRISMAHAGQYLSANFEYSKTSHERFVKDGFIQFFDFLTQEGLEALRVLVNGVWENHHVQWVDFDADSQHVTEAAKLGSDPRLLEMMTQVLEEPVLHAVTAIIPKQGTRSIESPWHRDAPYFITIWICLDDVDAENGALMVKPGWHRKGALTNCECSTIDFAKMGTSIEEFQKDCITYKLKAGQAAMHHPLLPHASFSNLSGNPRRVISLRYAAKSQWPRDEPHKM